MSQHFMEQCSCGKIIRQCRCSDRNKVVTIVKNGCQDCVNKRLTAHPISVPIEEYEKRAGIKK